MYSAVAAAALLAGSAVAAYSNDTVITTDVTVTDYTTYCPYSTEVVIKTCTLEKCAPVTITVSEAQTLTVTGECVIPTTYTTEYSTTTSTVACEECEKSTVAPVSTAAPETSSAAPSTVAAVSSFEAGAAKNVAGALAGVAAVAVALI
ncbi:putative GPI-anchored protein 26 [Meyerozyma sp. JA9]|jgi:hypothetical protein|nr:putative GPI-anchored protein 26 [Meyerozyma sp. JA9]